MVVIGGRRESRQDLSRKVGMISREHEELEDRDMAERTSSGVAGRKSERTGGGGLGGASGTGAVELWKAADSLVILPLKNSRKDDARLDVELPAGKVLGEERERRASKHDQSFLGWLVQVEIRDLK
jgi:hypothetical protein